MAQNIDINIGATPLGKLVNQVELELGAMLKSELEAEAQRLAKARPGEETPGEASASPDASASDPTGENTSVASTSPDASSPAPDASASPDASAPPAGPDASADPAASASPDDGSAPADPAADQGPIDPQALAAEYAKLPPEDLKAHYYAIKEVLFQAASAAGGDGSAPAPAPADASAAPAGGPPAPDASAPAIKAEIGMKDDPKANGENPLGKSEPVLTRDEIRAQLKEKIGSTKLSKSDTDAIINFDLNRVGVDKVAHMLTGAVPLGKSEPKVAVPAAIKAPVEGTLSKAEGDKLKEDLAKTNAALAVLVKAVKVAVETPMRKSVQFAADLKIPGDGRASKDAPATTLTRDQVRAQLKEKATDMKLTKSDRLAIIDFDTGRVTVDKVAHLLK